MPRVEFSYVAVKPISAEHPVGSGKTVDYAPGDIIPAEDWGMAAHNLVELGKAARLAVNVMEEDDLIGAGFSDEASPLHQEVLAFVEDHHEGSGWYNLSNGERMRGKKPALVAELKLRLAESAEAAEDQED